MKQTWTFEETSKAFLLYLILPSGQVDMNNPVIIKTAGLLGKTPRAVAMKIGNILHADPFREKRSASGLSHGSKVEKEVWDHFLSEGIESFAEAAVSLSEEGIINLPDSPNCGSEVIFLQKERIGQQILRKSVLAAYGGRRCITGMNCPDLLNTSHIKPWKDSSASEKRIPQTRSV